MNVVFITVVLFLWNLAVVHYISRWFYEYFKKFEDIPAEYVGRKVVHIMSGGITALLIPIFYQGYYWIVSISAFLFAFYIYFRRRRGMMYWFQVQENAYELHFALAYGAILIVGIFLGDVWIGLIPMLFMSFGDSVTGIVRAFTQKRQIKSWDGTIAMFVVCSVIGFYKLGKYGILLSAIVSLVERIPKIDDNITVPIVTASLVYLERILR